MKVLKHILDIIFILLLIYIAIVCIIPLIHILAVSFSARDASSTGKVFFLPVKFTFDAYLTTLQDTPFLRSFVNSLVRVVLGTALNIFLTISLAYPLSKRDNIFRVKKIFIWFLIIPLFFNVGFIPNYILISELNLLDTIWSLILPGAVPVFSVILMINFFKSIPTVMEDIAILEGANPFQIFYSIYLPLSKPSITLIAVLAAIWHWNEFFDGMLYIDSISIMPLMSYLHQSFSIRYQEIATYGLMMHSAKVIVAIIPVLIIYPLLRKYFVKNILV